MGIVLLSLIACTLQPPEQCGVLVPLEEVTRVSDFSGQYTEITVINGNQETAWIHGSDFVAAPPFAYDIEAPASLIPGETGVVRVLGMVSEDQFYFGYLRLTIETCGEEFSDTVPITFNTSSDTAGDETGG